jgi:hypothetical protein
MDLSKALEKNSISLPSIFYEAVEVSAEKLYTAGQDAGFLQGKREAWEKAEAAVGKAMAVAALDGANVAWVPKERIENALLAARDKNLNP